MGRSASKLSWPQESCARNGPLDCRQKMRNRDAKTNMIGSEVGKIGTVCNVE